MIYYADDTILFSRHSGALNDYLDALIVEAAKYGLHLNKEKCKLIRINGKDALFFPDDTEVEAVTEAKYLGCTINDRINMHKEIIKRLSEVFLTWKRLEVFWKHCDVGYGFKLQVYDSIINQSLMYGLESAQLNKSHLERLNQFQRRGLRQILKVYTTYGAMQNSLERSDYNKDNLYSNANAALKKSRALSKPKII